MPYSTSFPNPYFLEKLKDNGKVKIKNEINDLYEDSYVMTPSKRSYVQSEATKFPIKPCSSRRQSYRQDSSNGDELIKVKNEDSENLLDFSQLIVNSSNNKALSY